MKMNRFEVAQTNISQTGRNWYKTAFITPACQPYNFWWPPLDVSTVRGGNSRSSAQVNKF